MAATDDFTTVLNSWKDADLSSIQLDLSNLTSSLRTTQTNSLESRKRLAEQTREFKRQQQQSSNSNSNSNSNTNTRDQDGNGNGDQNKDHLKSLLKAYQSEIDHLTNRSRFAENHLIDLDSRLRDTKDPLACLEIALEQATALTSLETLQSSYSSLSSSYQSLTSLQSSTNSENLSLKAQISRLESQLEGKLSALESSIQARYEEKISNLNHREQVLQDSLKSNDDILKDLRKRNEFLTLKLVGGQEEGEGEDENGIPSVREGANQGRDDERDPTISSSSAYSSKEMEILESEIYNLKKRIHELSIRNEGLVSELEAEKRGADSTSTSTLTSTSRSTTIPSERDGDNEIFESKESEYEVRLKALEDRGNENLREEVGKRTRVELELSEMRKNQQRLIRDLERSRKLNESRRNYDELKREVEIMRMVEFNVGFDDDEEEVEEEDHEEEKEGEQDDHDETEQPVQIGDDGADQDQDQHQGQNKKQQQTIEVQAKKNDAEKTPKENKGKLQNKNGIQSKNKTKTKNKSLESLLLEKNRKLEREVTNLRVSNSTLQSSSSSNDNELNQLRNQVSKLKSLNERLEEDLMNVGVGSSSNVGDTIPNSVPDSERIQNLGRNQDQNENEQLDANDKGLDLDASSQDQTKKMSNLSQSRNQSRSSERVLSAEEALAELENLSSMPRSSKSSYTATPASSSTSNLNANTNSSSSSTSSLIPILTSQRDRFKLRNSELEEELRKQYEIIRDLRNELKRLNSDNLGLYEKVRYLSNYRDELSSNGRAGAGAVGTAREGLRAVQVESGVGVGVKAREYPPNRQDVMSSSEDGYRERYEQSMNPFEAFRGRVS